MKFSLFPPLGGVVDDLSDLAANVAAWLKNPTSANLAAALTDELGTGLALFGSSVSTTCELADASSGGNVASAAQATLNYQIAGGRCSGNITLLNIDTTGLTAGNTVFIRGLPTARTITNARFPISQTVGGVVTMPANGYGGYAISGGTYLTLNNIVSDIASGTGDIFISFDYPI